jgi:hypothetical protein
VPGRQTAIRPHFYGLLIMTPLGPIRAVSTDCFSSCMPMPWLARNVDDEAYPTLETPYPHSPKARDAVPPQGGALP